MRRRISLDPGPQPLRSYPNMPAIDCRPPLDPLSRREWLRYTPGQGWGPPLRDDLVLQPWARALGWKVSHPGDNWHHGAQFSSLRVSLWAARDGWQARNHTEDLTAYGPRRVYGDRAVSLFTALLREAPLLLEHKS